MLRDDSNMSEDRKEKYDAYGHLRKNMEEKQLQKGVTSSGTPKIVQVFVVSMLLLSILVFSGSFTSDPWEENPDNEKYRGEVIPTSDGGYTSLKDYCVDHATYGLHYHFILNIIIDGNSYPIPSNIGVSSGCMKPLHTHSTDNRIHVELPQDYDGSFPNVGVFFEIWAEQNNLNLQKAFSSNNVLDYTGTVTMSVNGDSKTGSLESFIPNDGDIIQIICNTN